MKEDSVLQGIRILDLGSDISAPYTARLLADNGAEVIKIEPPGGDTSRRKGAFLNHKPDPETSSLFIALNTSKKGITLDITKTKGRELLLKMMEMSDAMIENYDPDYLASLNLGYDTLSKHNAKLVLTSITNFGQEGPYRNWDTSEGAIQAFSGLMTISGEPDRSPIKTGLPLAQYTAGLTGFASTLAAVYHAQLTGEGQHVDIALCDAIAANIDQLSLAWSFDYPDKEMRSRYGLRRGPLEGLYQCRDGFIGCTTTDFSEVKRLATIVSPDLDYPDKFGNFYYGSVDNEDEMEAILIPWFLEHDKRPIMEMTQGVGLAYSYVADIKDLVEANPQLSTRNSLVELEHPRIGNYLACAPSNRYIGPSFKLKPAPLLSQHTEEILTSWLGLNRNEIATLKTEGVI